MKTKTISTKDFSELAGLTPRRLRQLAEEGKLMPPKRGQWPFPECVSRLIEHYRELAEPTAFVDAKTQREQSRARIAKVEADLAEKRVVPLEEVRRCILSETIAAKNKFQFADAAISAEAQMRLSLPGGAVSELREIMRRHRRAALMELHTGKWGEIKCPHCNSEIKTYEESQTTKQQ